MRSVLVNNKTTIKKGIFKFVTNVLENISFAVKTLMINFAALQISYKKHLDARLRPNNI